MKRLKLITIVVLLLTTINSIAQYKIIDNNILQTAIYSNYEYENMYVALPDKISELYNAKVYQKWAAINLPNYYELNKGRDMYCVYLLLLDMFEAIFQTLPDYKIYNYIISNNSQLHVVELEETGVTINLFLKIYDKDLEEEIVLIGHFLIYKNKLKFMLLSETFD